jgi:ABC-type sugar transport system substrate-binding protein
MWKRLQIGVFSAVRCWRRWHPRYRRAVLPLAAAAWCGLVCSPSPRPSTHPKLGFIAVVGAGQNDPLWPVLRGSALRLQGFVGEIRLRAEAPPTVSSHAQAELIQRLRSEGMRGLCIQVIDPAAIAPHVRRLANEGVAVVTMIRPLEGRPVLMYSGVDQRLVGEALADAIGEALQYSGTIAVLHANSKSEDVQEPDYARERYEGFKAGLQRYPRITVLRELDCGGNAQRAQAMIRHCMERFPRLNGWVAMENWPLRGLDPQERLLPPTCKLVTTDPDPQVWDHLATGACYAMIAADYDKIAQEAVINCTAALEGNPVAWRTLLTKPRTVRTADLHTYKADWIKWCSRQEN